MSQFDRDDYHRSKSELLQILRHLGLPQETIDEIGAQLPDRVDMHEAATLLQRYGLTRDEAMSRLGGSP